MVTVALDVMGVGCGHSSGVSMEVLSVWPPSRPMPHRSWAPPELLYWEPLLCSLTLSFISEVWVAFHKVDSGHRKDVAASHRRCLCGKVVMVLGSFR